MSLRRSDRVTPAPLENPPLHGWAVELVNAKDRNKKKPCSKNRLRIAKTASILRQWQLCKKAAEAGLHKGGASDDETKQFRNLLNAATEELGKDSFLTRDKFYAEMLLPKLFSQEKNIHRSFIGESGRANLNNLHEAAYLGDVLWLEEAIAKGVAIDYTVRQDFPNPQPQPLPKNCTALLLAMAPAASLYERYLSDPDSHEWINPIDIQKLIRCAVILVRQGADFNRRFEMPTISGPVDFDSICGQFEDMVGMSAKEMAAIVDDQELLEAINLTEEAPMGHAWCRCGSRLRWSECHAAPSVCSWPAFTRR